MFRSSGWKRNEKFFSWSYPQSFSSVVTMHKPQRYDATILPSAIPAIYHWENQIPILSIHIQQMPFVDFSGKSRHVGYNSISHRGYWTGISLNYQSKILCPTYPHNFMPTAELFLIRNSLNPFDHVIRAFAIIIQKPNGITLFIRITIKNNELWF